MSHDQMDLSQVEHIWCPQPGPQLLATLCPADIIFFGGARGGGKLQPVSSHVLGPKGWVKFSSVKRGDRVTDPDTGGSQEVIGVYPQGEVDIYRVKFDDGAEIHAGLEHLWAYKCANRRRPGAAKKSKQRERCKELGVQYSYDRFSYYRVGTTGDLIKELEGGGHNPRVPLCNPVLFDVNGRTGDNDVPPYLIGLMLGDGTFSKGKSGNRCATGDQEIAEYLAELGFTQNSAREAVWYLPASNLLNKQFNTWGGSHGLHGKTGKDKFIPSYIFTANLDYRLSVLQGLLDSDGYVDNRGHVEFVSVSDHLAFGVRDLVRSFGGKATVSDEITGHYRKDDGSVVECKTYRRVHIRSNLASHFFGLSRKKERCNDEWNGGHENMRKVVSIEYSHREEATCIQVSSLHGLYITDDYVVTHNTDTALGRQVVGADKYEHAWSGLFLRRHYKHFKELRRRIDELIRHGLPATRVGGDQQTNVVKFDNGARIMLTAVEREEQLEFFQGQQFCVAEGTRILMGDGSPKNIEDIEAGDEVQTLEGPRRVRHKMAPRRDLCVRADTPYGSQLHPVEHPILDSGSDSSSVCDWRSYASILGICSKDIEQNNLRSATPPVVSFGAELFRHVLGRGSAETSTPIESCTSPEFCSLLIGSKGTLGETLSFRYSGFEQLGGPNLYNTDHSAACCDEYFSCATQCVCQTAAAQGSPGRCGCEPHHSGGLSRPVQEFALDTPLPQGDVDERSLCYEAQLEDAQGNAQLHSLRCLRRYWHPYDGTVRQATDESFSSACCLSPYGFATVYDITVDEVNHYISYDTGLINVNTEISIEEATQFAFVGKMIDKLKACLRSPHGVDPHMFLTGNPGGPGHNQIKQRFITPARQGGVPLKDGSETGMFIPSNVEDNRILVENDPKYVNRLRSIKDPNLRAAWLVGDWDVVMGGFFDDVWDETENVIPRFSVPEHWPRAMGLDWGTAKPFSVGWYAVSGGEFIPELGYALPRGAVVRYAEWYGCKEDEANTGLRLNSDQVAQGILAREWQRGEENLVFDRIADPSIFKVDDGPSIGEKFANEGVVMRRGDNRRIYGWDELRKLMAKKELDDGSKQPMFYVTHNCEAFRRTVPILERDEKEWDDLDTEGEDHVADEVRYVVMSRPASGISKSEHEMEQFRPKYGYFRRDWDEITADPEDSEDMDWGPANMDDPMTDVLDAIDVTTERRD